MRLAYRPSLRWHADRPPGAISFSAVAHWNFAASKSPQAGQNDFLSVAEHEIAHVLGFGTANSWKTRLTLSGGKYVGPFTGPKAVAPVREAAE